ncbi:hypothetical protein HBI81_249290 [Parastagonospora nodorum]|nr:hypothetical protein HBI73_237700 [Parastagonospora nodorum]KAH5621124.1 hypothetical protein HBI23_241040 [Parastagonospora nodorum]KAH6510923.1 hypothetical protein HBI81_249290 [Parastagonospora nodorum]
MVLDPTVQESDPDETDLSNILAIMGDNTAFPDFLPLNTPDSDPTDFLKTYRQILEREDAYKDKLRHNLMKQEEAYHKMLALKTHFQELQDETNRIRARSKDVQSSALAVLGNNLRNEAYILNWVPAQTIGLEIPEGPKIHGYEAQTIRVGSMIDGGAEQSLQAFIASTNGEEGVPRIKLACWRPKTNVYKSYSVADVFEKAELRTEFQGFKTDDFLVLPVVIMTCFVLKGIKLPRDFRFEPWFTEALARAFDPSRASGKYQNNAEKRSTLQIVSSQAAMRKTEQRGPKNQMFGPLHRGSQALGIPVSPEAPNGAEASTIKSYNECQSVAVSARAQEVPQTPTQYPRLRAHQPRTPAIQSVQSPTASSNSTPPKPTLQDPESLALMRDVLEYDKQREENDKLSRGLDTMNNKMVAFKQGFEQRLKASHDYIKDPLRQKHDKQKSEADILESNYKEVEAEQGKQTRALLQQPQAEIARKELDQKKLRKKRRGTTFDQLLDIDAAQQPERKKQKRWDSSDGL